mmetsp:Transcript_2891/g.4080  ORF Transcript_2891/g.4080 Transcript_2891/m.4080 type:complete len:131 (+) Transcript_2891:47-439(+)
MIIISSIISLSIINLVIGLEMVPFKPELGLFFTSSVQRIESNKTLFPMKGKLCGPVMNDSNNYKKNKAGNVWQCVGKCKSSNFCKGISYNANTKDCFLLKKNPAWNMPKTNKNFMYCGRIKYNGGDTKPI